MYGGISEDRPELERDGAFFIEIRLPSVGGFRVSLVSLEEGGTGTESHILGIVGVV
jgi:hypothetical protein